MAHETSAEAVNQRLKHSIANVQSQIKSYRNYIQGNRINAKAAASSDTSIRLEINSVDANDDVLKDLNVFPSTDWKERLQLIKVLLPYIEFDNISSTGTEPRVISCTVLSPLLFQLQLNLHIDSEDAIVETKVTGLLAVKLMAPQYASVLKTNYISRNKVQNLLYSLNSFAASIHRRTNAFVEVIRKYPGLVTNVNQDSLANNYTTYAHLKSCDEIILLLPANSIKLCIFWSVVLEDEITGECTNTINLIGPDPKSNELFQMLLESNSMVNAVSSLLSTCYNYV